ncbi:mannose-6-phosphate isomerase, class I [Kitasatospora phosalacinea]|uniref:mannose-6-phosphate isomerase n=1 Tax=Kitasatospora phosalacinea TaxID=2065 RepID=A0A9W6V4U7_9ACTN|nr:mannose-6-phosphate isomerase, class I [Kitasatospora phosalacinea]GLW75076.1 mannose-6-phosphate isomerase, class I [Kitasatospora phosalacinea]
MTADLLATTIRPYAWGSTTALARLTGRPPTGEPEAELWMGAHPGAPSRIDRGAGGEPLDAVIARDPAAELGPRVADRFGPRLPFLLKVLAAEHALSVQVHPTSAQAAAGYAAEDAAGVPLDAPHRIYRDRSHKPELICALGEFDALCGFRDPRATADLWQRLDLPVLAPWIETLRTAPAEQALRTVLTGALAADRARGDRAAAELPSALQKLAQGDGADAPTWAAYLAAARDYPGDPGLLAAMLLNHVHLGAGQALYLDAGVPHAYLRGLGVEIMANSDNVLRCGLTPKHVDTAALAAVVDFRPTAPHRAPAVPVGPGELEFLTPAEEFTLSRIELGAPVGLDDDGPQLLLCTRGTARVEDGPALGPGDCAYVPAASGPLRLTGDATVFRAKVPRAR